MVARISIFFARLSILLLYIRIFFPIGTPRSTFWWIIQIVIYLNLLYTISLILVTTLQCVPYHLPWGSSCVNQVRNFGSYSHFFRNQFRCLMLLNGSCSEVFTPE